MRPRRIRGTLVAARCALCGADMIYTEWAGAPPGRQIRCPCCAPEPHGRDDLRALQSGISLRLMMLEGRQRRALDPQESGTTLERVMTFRSVADELGQLATELVPAKQDDGGG